MPLRPSQVETLRAVQQCDCQRAAAGEVGALVNCSLYAAKRRLADLTRRGYLMTHFEYNRCGLPYFRLTQLGREALEGEQ